MATPEFTACPMHIAMTVIIIFIQSINQGNQFFYLTDFSTCCPPPLIFMMNHYVFSNYSGLRVIQNFLLCFFLRGVGFLFACNRHSVEHNLCQKCKNVRIAGEYKTPLCSVYGDDV